MGYLRIQKDIHNQYANSAKTLALDLCPANVKGSNPSSIGYFTHVLVTNTLSDCHLFSIFYFSALT